MLIGLTGPAGVGKDTVGGLLAMLHGYTQYAFARPIKAALAAMNIPEPETREQKEAVIQGLGVSYRHLAQTLGTEWGRNCVAKDFWLRIAQKSITSDKTVITDVRFEEEAAWLRAAGGVIVHVHGRATTVVGVQAKHSSEFGIIHRPGDRLLCNDTNNIATLAYQVKSLMSIIGE